MANATMQALQTHAEKLNQQVAEVNASIKALGDVPDDSPALQEYRKQLRRLNSDLKDVNTTMKDYTRGVKAAGELYRHYAMGNIEDMSIKAIRAGVNGMKKRYDNLKAGGDPGDAEEMRLIEAITTEADVVVKRFKTDYQHVVEEIARGGTVTEQTLKRTRDGLADLMQTAETEAEKNELTNYWQKVGAAIEAVAVENRRLRGEVADREEAMRIAYATDHDGSQQAIHDAEARADAARRENDELRQRLDLKQQQRRELEQEMDINSMQVRSLMDRRDELKAQEKEDRAIRNQRVDDANKELNAARRAAKTQQQAYDEQKQTVEKLRTEVQGLTDDIRKMGEVKAEPKIDTSAIDAKLEELRGSLSRVQQMKSTAQEKIASAKEVLGDTDKPWNNERVKKALEEDRVTQEENVAKLNAKWDEYWEKQERNAREFAAVLNKAAIDDVDWDEFYTHVTGPNAEMAKSWYRVQQRNMRGVDYWGEDSDNYKELVSLRASKKLGSASDGMLEELKLLEALKRKWDEYQKALNKAREESPKYDAAYNELDKARTEIIQQERLLETYTEHERQLKEQIAETEKLSQAQQQSAQSSEQLAQKQEQLSQKTAELNQQQDKLNGMVDETVTANQRLARAEQEQTDARNAQAEAKKHEGEAVKKVEDELRGLTDEQLKNAQAYSHLTEEINTDTAAMQRNITTEQEATREADRLRSGSIDKMEQALARLRESNRKLDPTIDKEEWERGERAIGQVTLRLEELKKQSAELRREPVLDMMTQRMQSLGTLSRDALQETKKFWQTMYDGADKNDPELKKIEERLKNIATEEDKRRAAQAERVIGNMGGSSDAEIKQAVQTMEQLRDAQAHGNAEWERFNKLAQEGKKYLEDLATVDSVIKYEGQMQNLTRLSDAALTETKKFWETMVAGAEKGSSELREYEAHLEKVKQEEQERKELSNEMKAQLVRTGTLGNFSESEIKESIAAAKELQSHMASASPEAKKLADAIANAEEHIKKYGIESARAAKRQQESDDTMRKQLSRMSEDFLHGNGMPSEAALKAQKRYWQQLIDDPKNAGKSLQQYRDSLAEVEQLMADMVKINGQTALEWFRNGSDKNSDANKIKEMADRLKAYRDTLPQESEAATIQYIDQLLQKVGASTKKATAELMDFEKAKEIALQAGDDVYGKQNPAFLASPEEIQAATKSIEKYREELFKTIKQKRDMGEATDAEEEELKELAKYLKDLKFEQDNFNMSREKMEQLMNQPVSAVSIDELRAAIKRADAELRRMEGSLGQNSDEYKRFAEQVRQAKNVMKEMEGQAKASATAWEKAFNRLKTYVVMYMGFNTAWQKVSATATDLMDLSDKMGEVRKTTQMTADEVGRLSENLKKMDVRTSLTSLMEISASAGQLGLKTLEDVQGFTEAANKLMIALPEMGREAATEMMRVAIATGEVDKIRKQLQEGTIEGSSATAVAMEKIASTIDRLRASSASTAPEITDFVKRVGAVGAQSGITIDQVAALGSTVSSLGMRIEMSATALSRMIPAIRNNAFELAKAIGVTPDTIRNLFDTGRGMEVILMILQRIKDTGMDADSVEQMLGMAGMRDIMKDLNQQGARAGIVFSGLSQNVDELRRQLGVASEAYEENIAIQQEFDKMNETTAAKWERLKNAFEEMFVGDEAQRGLGVLIDMLRGAVDIINDLQGYIVRIGIAFAAWKAGVGGAIWTYLINPIRLALTGVHSLDFQVKGLAATWRTAWKSMDAATKTNWIFAIISAVVMLGKHIYDTATRISELQQELNRLDNETDDAVRHVGRLVTSFNEVSVKANAANKKEAELREQTEKLSKEVDKLKKSTDDGTASADELKKKQAELEEKEKQLKKATDESNKANKERSNLISEMNSKYSTYLGYMLNEKTAAEQVASAHQLIIAALKEERKQKGLNALHDAVDKEYAEDIKEYSEDSQSNLKDIPRGAQRRILDQWRRVLTAATIDADKGEFRLSGVNGVTKGGTYRSEEELKKAMRSALREIIKTEAADVSGNVKVSTWAGKGIKSVDTFLNDIWGNSIDDGFGDWAETYISRERDIAQATHDNQVEVNQAHQETVQAAVADINSNMEALRKTSAKNNKFTDDQIRSMAQNVNALVAGYERHSEDMADSERNRIFGEGNEATLQNAVNNVLANLDQNTRARVFRVAQRGKKTGTGDVDTNITNPWGTSERADSTTYTEMTAEQLVNRREQMNKFVNSIQTDTDVKAVLNEDKALKKAIEAGMSSDMRTVIEWYNTERLKIQDELHARHLTNTGDWLDPKKERGAKKQFRDEMDAYLHELDAYYTERKTRIEQARNDEEITEGEAWRRTIQNDNEWQTRRAELQKLYSRKQQEVTQEELDAIIRIIAERTGDSESFVKAAIAKTNQFVDAIEKSGDKGAAIVHRWMSQVVLDTERSYLKAAQAIGKQMKFIEDTLAKERPYDGITKNLQDNLDKMGVLAAKFRRENEELARQGKGPKYSNEQITAQSYDEMAFYLRQAADAYSIDIDELLRRMVKEGMAATAEEISKSDMLKQAVMGQLRKTYQEVQDAIKKEASQIKKDVEIIWNDDARGIGGMSMKATFDKALAQLGMQQDSVSRANSLIGAGAASDNVASRLAMKQIEVQMRMQKAQYDMYRVQANQRMAALKAEAEEHRKLAKLAEQKNDIVKAGDELLKATNAERDAENVRLSLGLTLAEETKKEEEQKAELLKIQEESQNRLYTSLREWADLLTSSLQGVMEASHAGDAEYYNERAKLNLTGKGGPGAGTYVVIDDAGTSDAKAHYEYLDERQALERQHEIEVQNAQAEAWKKLWDDINMKMSEQITDWMNSALQSQSIDANTQAVIANTEALWAQLGQTGGQQAPVIDGYRRNADGFAMDEQGQTITPVQPVEMPTAEGEAPAWKPVWQMTEEERAANQEGIISMWQTYSQAGNEAMAQMSEAIGALPNPVPDPVSLTPESAEVVGENAAAVYNAAADAKIAASDRETQVVVSNSEKQKKAQTDANNQTTKNTQSSFAKMATAANMYGIAYQTMSNDNLSTAQKFQVFALQAAGQAAISMLTMDLAAGQAKNTVQMPGILGKLLGEMPYPAAIATFAGITALMGGLMALAMSSVTKSKSEIAQATGASVGAGRLATGMLTYAEGNVNELTDPASLTPGRQYNVDGADGKTYRARYMGKGAKTHITNGPEFHLVGEAGREAIIDAKTTRLLQMNETGIWRDIQTLYNGGSISGLSTRRRRGGVGAFADGNIGEFDDMGSDAIAANGTGGMSIEMLASLQASIDRQSDLLENALVNGIKAVNKWTGSDGIPAMYNKMQKEAQRHGEKYL